MVGKAFVITLCIRLFMSRDQRDCQTSSLNLAIVKCIVNESRNGAVYLKKKVIMIHIKSDKHRVTFYMLNI